MDNRAWMPVRGIAIIESAHCWTVCGKWRGEWLDVDFRDIDYGRSRSASLAAARAYRQQLLDARH